MCFTQNSWKIPESNWLRSTICPPPPFPSSCLISSLFPLPFPHLHTVPLHFPSLLYFPFPIPIPTSYSVFVSTLSLQDTGPALLPWLRWNLLNIKLDSSSAYFLKLHFVAHNLNSTCRFLPWQKQFLVLLPKFAKSCRLWISW